MVEDQLVESQGQGRLGINSLVPAKAQPGFVKPGVLGFSGVDSSDDVLEVPGRLPVVFNEFLSEIPALMHPQVEASQLLVELLQALQLDLLPVHVLADVDVAPVELGIH